MTDMEKFKTELEDLKEKHKKFTDDISNELDNIIEKLKLPSTDFESAVALLSRATELDENFKKENDEYNEKLVNIYAKL